MFVAPIDMPVANPDADPILATPGLLLVHVPPEGAPANVVVEPTHISVIPLIVGALNTLTLVVAAVGHVATPFTFMVTE